MNTFRAILLPCAGTAGGVPAQPSAAGRPIAVCGSTHPDPQHLTRVSRSAAQTAGRREVVTDRIRVRRGPALGGIWKNVRTFRLLNPARISFLGSARVQLRQKSLRCIRQAFHLQNSFRNASASELHWIIGAKAWGAEKLSNRSRKS